MLDRRATVVHCHSTESAAILLHASSAARQLLTPLTGHGLSTVEAEFVLFRLIDCFCYGAISCQINMDLLQIYIQVLVHFLHVEYSSNTVILYFVSLNVITCKRTVLTESFIPWLY